jgi:hypothetical protein
MIQTFAACLALALSAGPALAGLTLCPATPQDAAKGLAVDYQDGSTSHTVLDPTTGDTVEVFAYADGYVMKSWLMLGMNTTRSADLDAAGAEIPDTQMVYDYAEPRPAALAPGLVWSSAYVVTGRGERIEGSYTMTVGSETQVKIGTCSYRAWPVTIFAKDPQFSFLVQSDFLPDLAIGLLRGYGEVLKDAVTVTPVSIRVDG